MSYAQISLFDFSCTEDDPVYLKLRELQKDDELDLYEIKVKRTEKFYEVEKSNEFHEGFKELMDCYKFINAKI